MIAQWISPHFGRFVLGAAMLLGLAACSPQIEGYDRPPDRTIVVGWMADRLDVQFPAGSATLDSAARQGLEAFLAGQDRSRPVYLIARTKAPTVDAELAIERATALREVLQARGFKLAFQPPKAAGSVTLTDPEWPDHAFLYAGRLEASVPGCPDWRKPTVGDYSNTPSSNLGCANAINLSLMVQDPNDLIEGQDASPTDGARAVLPVFDYRAGIAPAFKEEAAPTASTSLTSKK